jgi:hypothetical protein
MPPLSAWPGLLPLARHYSSRKCNKINVTTLGKDCCSIVNSFEKNYREKKDLIALRVLLCLKFRQLAQIFHWLF